MSTPFDKVIPHLHRVKRTGPDRGLACCPAHDDTQPSMSWRELDDGRLLVHCWAGCSALDIVGAIGLEMVDLFPPRPDSPGGGHAPRRRPWSAGDLIDLAANESGVAAVICSDVLHGKPEPDLDRLLEAAGRLADVKEAVHGRR